MFVAQEGRFIVARTGGSLMLWVDVSVGGGVRMATEWEVDVEKLKQFPDRLPIMAIMQSMINSIGQQAIADGLPMLQTVSLH